MAPNIIGRPLTQSVTGSKAHKVLADARRPMAGRDARDDVRPKPPPGPRPRGTKKEKGEANESSPRKGDRERRDSRSKGDGGAETEKSPKKSNRRSHRRSKESLITSDNWRQHFDEYNATKNSDAFSQHSRGSLNLYFSPLSAEDMIKLTKVHLTSPARQASRPLPLHLTRRLLGTYLSDHCASRTVR